MPEEAAPGDALTGLQEELLRAFKDLEAGELAARAKAAVKAGQVFTEYGEETPGGFTILRSVHPDDDPPDQYASDPGLAGKTIQRRTVLVLDSEAIDYPSPSGQEADD